MFVHIQAVMKACLSIFFDVDVEDGCAVAEFNLLTGDVVNLLSLFSFVYPLLPS